jgi:predicted porin
VRFAGQRVTVDIARLHYTESGQAGNGKFLRYRKPNWAVGYETNFGPWGLATQYVRAGSGTCELTGGVDCSTTGLQAWMWSFGARYRFDRQTFVYLIGSKLSNGTSARMDNWAGSDPNRGEDIKQVALGVSYSF